MEPLLQLNAYEVHSLLRSAYGADNPRRALEALLEVYSIPPLLLSALMHCVVCPPSNEEVRSLALRIQDTRRALASMQPATIKEQFVFYATAISHVWMHGAGVSLQHPPVFYRAPNRRVPYVWLDPNPYGMPCVVASCDAPPFRVSLTRREVRGDMMPLELEFFQPTASAPRVSMDVVVGEGFNVTGVELCVKPDFVLLLTREMRYLRTVLVRPSAGACLLCPVCLHKLE
jgi:hypothetical protein